MGTKFLDLDVVIVDNIDGFFDVPGDFVVIRKWTEKIMIIIFHGKPNSEDVNNGRSGQFFRRVVPVQWVSDHWR